MSDSDFAEWAHRELRSLLGNVDDMPTEAKVADVINRDAHLKAAYFSPYAAVRGAAIREALTIVRQKKVA